MIGMDGEKESGKYMLSVQLDDEDDDDEVCYFVIFVTRKNNHFFKYEPLYYFFPQNKTIYSIIKWIF